MKFTLNEKVLRRKTLKQQRKILIGGRRIVIICSNIQLSVGWPWLKLAKTGRVAPNDCFLYNICSEKQKLSRISYSLRKAKNF